MIEPEFYSDIFDYLDTIENTKSVTSKGFDDLVLKIRAYTGLSEEESEIVLKYFFQSIRSYMLRGEEVFLKGFGKFFISSPVVTNNKKKVFPKFEACSELTNKINVERNKS